MSKLKLFYVGNDKWFPQLANLYENLAKKSRLSGVLCPPESSKIISYCKKHQIALVITNNINVKVKKILTLKPDLILVTGHPYLLKKELLKICPVIGFHPSLLPKRRGRAPLNWAIIDGLRQSGVTTFNISEGIDNGSIIFQQSFKIGSRDTVADLIDKVNQILEKMITKIINNYPNLPSKKQDESLATYTPKRTPADSQITLDMPAKHIERLVRALTGPYPPAFIKNNKGEKIYIKTVGLNE